MYDWIIQGTNYLSDCNVLNDDRCFIRVMNKDTPSVMGNQIQNQINRESKINFASFRFRLKPS